MKIKITISITIVVIIIFVLTIFGLRINSNKKEQKQILNKIEQLQQLVTAKQIYREVIYSKESKDFLWIPLANKEFLFALDYTLTAGIDISKGYKTEKKDEYFIITLPKAQIFSIDADDTTIKEYFVKQRFTKLNRDDYFKLIKESKESILLGDSVKILLEESEINARILLQSLLQITGIRVEVEFSDSVIKVLK